jgi:uncharacterized iron-regulated protein
MFKTTIKAFSIGAIAFTLTNSVSAEKRASIWIDVQEGEPVTFNEVVNNLEKSKLIYLGERHTIQRHHDIQAKIVDELGKKGISLVIGFEQIEAKDQPWLDKYCDGKISFEEFAGKISWGKYWNNYKDYKDIMENARRYKARLIGLNAPRLLIRKIGRKGLKSLTLAERAQLPEKINTNDPAYGAHLREIMMGMVKIMPAIFKNVKMSAKINKMLAAQMTRDEMMASQIYKFLAQPAHKNYKAIIILGSGHVNYGFGTPQRVRRRMPRVTESIIVMSSSGDIKMAKMKMPHAKRTLKTRKSKINKPVADYLHVVALEECKVSL